MGALLVAWVVVDALPPPPTDGGAACEQWTDGARRAVLERRARGTERAVVAVADPAFEAEELRLALPGSRPTTP